MSKLTTFNYESFNAVGKIVNKIFNAVAPLKQVHIIFIDHLFLTIK